eukprot:scaffold589033_cov19-Prasinocladus_malaysianus.AAC.1
MSSKDAVVGTKGKPSGKAWQHKTSIKRRSSAPALYIICGSARSSGARTSFVPPNYCYMTVISNKQFDICITETCLTRSQDAVAFAQTYDGPSYFGWHACEKAAARVGRRRVDIIQTPTQQATPKFDRAGHRTNNDDSDQ